MSITLIRKPVVNERRGRSNAQLYVDIQNGIFPPPVRVGERLSAWPENEVDEVIAAEVSGATPEELRRLVRKLVSARKGKAAA